MAWQPEQEPLAQLSKCLKDSLSGREKEVQKQAEIVRIKFVFVVGIEEHEF